MPEPAAAAARIEPLAPPCTAPPQLVRPVPRFVANGGRVA